MSLIKDYLHNKMTQTQEQQFQEWLQSCPVEYHLLDSDYDQQSYQFIVQSEEEE